MADDASSVASEDYSEDEPFENQNESDEEGMLEVFRVIQPSANADEQFPDIPAGPGTVFLPPIATAAPAGPMVSLPIPARVVEAAIDVRQRRGKEAVERVTSHLLALGIPESIIKRFIACQPQPPSPRDPTLVERIFQFQLQCEQSDKPAPQRHSVADRDTQSAGFARISQTDPPEVFNRRLQKLLQFARELEQMKDDRLCSVCLERPKDMLIVPCGHIATCMACSKRLHKCPLCRASVQRMYRAHF
eukprot:TRINITY_DN4580_c0_g1_i1.p1 TRINITY_DN4580_c0_g1~~TRINITY_DN4580_c0_g1_i1.p1  ORF type:complete len:260 (-),score=41.22 TRINITY_DN4580_c0_g1_i1:198-938(-)